MRLTGTKTVVVNALNSNSGGGRSIRDSYLKMLNEQSLQDRYVVLAAKGANLVFLTNPNIEVRELPSLFSKTTAAPFVYHFVLGRIISRIGADVVFNLGDLIVNTSARQLYVFDWSYALDVHEQVWARMTTRDRLVRKLKLHLLKAQFRKADVVIAQTDHIRKLLIEKYQLKDVRVIGNAVTLDSALGDEQTGFDLPAGVRLVCPSVYYPHKNLEILLDLADLIKTRGLDYRIITTVYPDSHAARRFVEAIAERRLQSVMTNIGPVPLSRMKSLYQQCDALLMPTLLESFSIVYPEAMHHGLPILTSNMWFAHSVCGDAAKYFNPFDAEDILRSIEDVFLDDSKRNMLLEAGFRQVSSNPYWGDNFLSFQNVIRELASGGEEDRGVISA